MYLWSVLALRAWGGDGREGCSAPQALGLQMQENRLLKLPTKTANNKSFHSCDDTELGEVTVFKKSETAHNTSDRLLAPLINACGRETVNVFWGNGFKCFKEKREYYEIPQFL